MHMDNKVLPSAFHAGLLGRETVGHSWDRALATSHHSSWPDQTSMPEFFLGVLSPTWPIATWQFGGMERWQAVHVQDPEHMVVASSEAVLTPRGDALPALGLPGPL